MGWKEAAETKTNVLIMIVSCGQRFRYTCLTRNGTALIAGESQSMYLRLKRE